MSFVSTGFVLFVTLAAIVCRIVPRSARWCVMLTASLAFYATGGYRALLYITFTTLVVYAASMLMQRIQDDCDNKVHAASKEDKAARKGLKAQCKRRKKRVAAIALVLCFGVLATLKYFNFVLSNIVHDWHSADFFVPLGISFYTFSVAGYLIDVYNNKYRAEANPFRLLLCVSWFPSIVQGPINRFDDLRREFFAVDKSTVSLRDAQFALQRILWGMIKKLVIADRAAMVVSYIFTDYAALPSFVILCGLVMYAIQLYADFAGGIDVALGVSELFGVHLKENFRQPYFSQSIAEFWRRWHITLGTWMKDYVFYPLSLSHGMANLSKIMPAKYLKRTVPAAIANIIIFIIVSIWHGAEWHFIVYGLYFGIIIAFSVMAAPLYKRLIALFHINDKSFGWRIFRTLRTFALVTLAGLVDDVKDLRQSAGLARQLCDVGNYRLWSNFSYSGFGKLTFAVVGLFCTVWFFVSVQKERGYDVRAELSKKPLVFRWAVYLALILVPPFFQSSHYAGFMYALF